MWFLVSMLKSASVAFHFSISVLPHLTQFLFSSGQFLIVGPSTRESLKASFEVSRDCFTPFNHSYCVNCCYKMPATF